MRAIILISVFLVGCAFVESDQDKFDRFMTELDCPVILIGITEKAAHKPSVVVRDGQGRVRTLTSYYGLPQAMSESREVGDTLKPCK